MREYPRRQVTVYLISRDMDKPFNPDSPRYLQKDEGAGDVRFNNRRRLVNASIHVRFRGKMGKMAGSLRELLRYTPVPTNRPLSGGRLGQSGESAA